MTTATTTSASSMAAMLRAAVTGRPRIRRPGLGTRSPAAAEGMSPSLLPWRTSSALGWAPCWAAPRSLDPADCAAAGDPSRAPMRASTTIRMPRTEASAVPGRKSVRSGGRAWLQLDEMAVGIAQVERWPGAIGPPALDDIALDRHAPPAQLVRGLGEVVTLNRQADVIDTTGDQGRLARRGRQQVDVVLAEPQVNERDALVDVIDRAAERVHE